MLNVVTNIMKRRQRKIFGKRRVEIANTEYFIFMRKDHLAMREKYSRREVSISLRQVVHMFSGQPHLPLSGI